MYENSIEIAYLKLNTLCLIDYITLEEQKILKESFIQLLELFSNEVVFKEFHDNENFKKINNILSPKLFLDSLKEISTFFKNFQITPKYRDIVNEPEKIHRKASYELFLHNLDTVYKSISSEKFKVILALNSLSVTLGFCEEGLLYFEKMNIFPYVSIYIQRIHDFINFYTLSNSFLILLDDINHLYLDFKKKSDL